MVPSGRTSAVTAREGLQTSLQFLPGVGPRRAGQLRRLDLETVEDALFFIPFRHEDRTRLTPLRSLAPGQAQSCSGTIVGMSPPPRGRPRVPFSVMLRDETGYATAIWFNAPYLERVFARGQRLVLHGKVARFRGAITIQHPDYEIVETGEDERVHSGRLVPMYHATEGYLAATNELMSLHVALETRRGATMATDVLARLAEIQHAHGALPRPPQVGRVIGLSSRPTTR